MIGSSVTELMFCHHGTYSYCEICVNKRNRYDHTHFVNETKFKCPEGKCNSSLSFREFMDEPCCTPGRTEFQDLTKMMKLLEITEKKDKKAKQEMELNQKRFEDATLIFSEKDVKRSESRKELAASFANAEAYMTNFDGKFVYNKFDINDK